MHRSPLPAPGGVLPLHLAMLLALLCFSGGCRASVIIDEIMQNPAAVSDSRGEWFELFNSSPAAVDLYHWRIADLGTDSHLIGDHIVMPAGGYAVLARRAAGNGGVAPDYVYGNDIVLSNGADQLLLFDAAGTEVDRVAWDGGPLFPDPNGASMALLDPGLDNEAGGSWTVSAAAFGDGDLGTPGAANFAVPDPAPGPAAMPLPPSFSLLAVPAAWLLLRRGGRRRVAV